MSDEKVNYENTTSKTSIGLSIRNPIVIAAIVIIITSIILMIIFVFSPDDKEEVIDSTVTTSPIVDCEATACERDLGDGLNCKWNHPPHPGICSPDDTSAGITSVKEAWGNIAGTLNTNFDHCKAYYSSEGFNCKKEEEGGEYKCVNDENTCTESPGDYSPCQTPGEIFIPFNDWKIKDSITFGDEVDYTVTGLGRKLVGSDFFGETYRNNRRASENERGKIALSRYMLQGIHDINAYEIMITTLTNGGYQIYDELLSQNKINFGESSTTISKIEVDECSNVGSMNVLEGDLDHLTTSTVCITQEKLDEAQRAATEVGWRGGAELTKCMPMAVNTPTIDFAVGTVGHNLLEYEEECLARIDSCSWNVELTVSGSN